MDYAADGLVYSNRYDKQEDGHDLQDSRPWRMGEI